MPAQVCDGGGSGDGNDHDQDDCDGDDNDDDLFCRVWKTILRIF